jgi:hypothetical protein
MWEISDGHVKRGVQMSMPSPTGPNWPEAMRPLEQRRRAREVAILAEYLAGDVRGHPDRTLEAMSALAERCDGNHELLRYACTEVVRDTQTAPSPIVENNRYAIQLLEFARSAS